jgi:hypothetical protein
VTTAKSPSADLSFISTFITWIASIVICSLHPIPLDTNHRNIHYCHSGSCNDQANSRLYTAVVPNPRSQDTLLYEQPTFTGTAPVLHSCTFFGLRGANTKLREFMGLTTGPPMQSRVNFSILANDFWLRARKDPRCFYRKHKYSLTIW